MTLLPCPFCGRPPRVFREGECVQICCTSEGCSVQPETSACGNNRAARESVAEKAWNTRNGELA